MGYKKANKLVIQGSCCSTNPVDSTTYYLGNRTADSLNTTADYQRLYIPVNGCIRACELYVIATATVGTAEDWTWVIRLNNATDYTFYTLGAAEAKRRFYNYNLNIPVSAGDYIELKTTTPAWVTNPEGVRCMAFVLVQY